MSTTTTDPGFYIIMTTKTLADATAYIHFQFSDIQVTTVIIVSKLYLAANSIAVARGYM